MKSHIHLKYEVSIEDGGGGGSRVVVVEERNDIIEKGGGHGREMLMDENDS